MNYLAHLLLAPQRADSQVGALLGDFTKGDLTDRYNAEIRREITIHRKIDSYTDAHPVVLDAKRMLEGSRRFAGILLDVFYDHALARQWGRYSEVELDIFIRQAYAALESRRELLPETLQARLPFMVREDWLGSYRQFDGVAAAIQRMARRLRYGDALLSGIDDLRRNADALHAGFDEFFPQLVEFVADYRRSLRESSVA